MKSKKKKNKDLFTKKKKPDKKVGKVKAIRTPKKVSPLRLVVRDWVNPMGEHKDLDLNEDSKLEIHIDGTMYTVSINKRNRCLEFSTFENNLFLQPISVKAFLVRATRKEKEQ